LLQTLHILKEQSFPLRGRVWGTPHGVFLGSCETFPLLKKVRIRFTIGHHLFSNGYFRHFFFATSCFDKSQIHSAQLARHFRTTKTHRKVRRRNAWLPM